MKRKASITRKTKETKIDVELNIDGKGQYKIDTGIGFLDHMLEQLSKHSSIDLKVEKLGEMDTELFKEWFQAFSQSAGITLHIENLYGDNSHHKVESCFKGLARSLRAALEIDPKNKKVVPSTKGSL